MSEDPDALCTWLVAWLEPDVGRDLGLSAADLRAWVGERVLPRVRAAASEHAIPGGAGASVERVLAGVATFVGEAVRDRADPGSEAPRHFLGRGRGIHRDLGGWLRSRLDEQLQRGMLGLDALLGPQSPSSLESRLELARAVRAVGREVIDVLARLEDGRRSRWRRPKLVLEPGTLVSLGLVPVALHDAIIDCLPQRQRWRERLSLRDAALAQLTPARKDALVVDTRLLPAELAARVVAGLPPPVLASASMAIHADNVDALRLLQVAAVRARCVFIDPPYNTGGHDFGYDDYFPGGSWAAMMGDRLELLRALLTEDGVLVATIDDGEVATLRGLLERVFGPEHFVTQAVWHKKYARQNDATWFSTAHDHVLVAARDKAKWRPHRVPRTAEQNKGYRNPDDDPRGPWQSVVYTCAKTAEQRPNLYYPLVHPRTGEEVWPEANRVWAFSPAAHARNEREGKVWWGPDQQRDKPRQKVFLRDVDRGMVPDTLWTRSQVGDNQDAQRELAALFGPVGRFPTPKPLRLAQRVLIMGSSPGDTVLDAFAGSGTTAHAALELQRGTDTAEAGPREPDGRRFVVVESGPSFAEVLVPRIEKAAYCGQWRDGEPVGGGGVPLCCRVLALESYDDALEGLRGSHEPLSRLLEPPAPEESLPPTAFAEPFDVRITLTRQGERRELAVSLVETFALLLGLRVETLGPLVQRGGTRARVMRGRDPAGQRVLVLWRTLDGTPAQQVEAAAARLRECLEGNAPPELVYVDGAHELDGAAWPRWRIEPIEATFRRRLWATD